VRFVAGGANPALARDLDDCNICVAPAQPSHLLAFMARRPPIIAVCGGAQIDALTADLAEAVGLALARAGAIIVCGGLGGVMEKSCQGAKQGGGVTIGIVPGPDTRVANQYVDVPIATGMAQGRNAVIVHTADGVIALPGSYGTLSEISLALNMAKPVVTVGSWCPIPNVTTYASPDEAVTGILSAVAALGEET
jgi:uncharacterized protein (TIGR00725 family)